MINGCHTRLREERIKVMAKKNEAKVKFSAETKEFNDAIKQSNKEISVLKSELKLNAAEMKNAGTSTEALGKKHQLLKKEQEAQRNKTKALNAQLQSAKHIFGEDSQEVTNLTKKLNASKVAESNLDKQIRDTNDELKQQQKQMGLSAEASEKLKSGLDKAGNASGTIAGAVGALAVASTANAVEQEITLDKLQSQLGLTESQMKSYDKVAREVYKGAYGNELQDVTNAIAEIRYQLGEMTDSELTNVTKNALTLADVFDMDVKESTRAVNSMMKQFNITADDAYNLIVQGAQNGLNQNDDLLDTINEYSVQFKNAGYSADDMFNMLANGTESGTWSVDKLGDAVKEMNIRFSDGTVKNALSENRGALGLTRKEIEQLQKGFNEGGKSAKDALKTTMEHLGAVKDESKRYQIGVSIFGTMWEDLGETTVRSLVNTEGAIRKTNNAMSKVDSLAYDNVATDIQMAKREFEELGKDILQDIGPEIREFAGWAQDNGDEIVTTIKTIGVVAGTTFAINKTVKFGRSLADISKFGAGVVKSVKAMALARVADTTATEAQTVAQNGLNASMLASPVGLTIASVTALAAGIYILANNTEQLSEESKKAISDMEELNSSISKSNESIQDEYGIYEKQAEQLDNIVDKNGKVKKGKEDLAQAIVDNFEKMGIEIDYVDGQIQGYKDLKREINKTIEAKKAEAYLETNKDDYVKAMKQEKEYAKKIADQKEKISKLSEEAEETDKKTSDFNQLPEKYPIVGDIAQLGAAITGQDPNQKSKAKHAEIEKAKKVLKDYENTYKNATVKITNYDKLQIASASGKTEKIKNATNAWEHDLKRASNSTKQELEKQLEDTRSNLRKMKDAYKEGSVSQAAVDEAKRTRDRAKKELEKANYKAEGKKSGKTYAEGISDTDVTKSVKKLTNKIKNQMKAIGTINLGVNFKIKSNNNNLNNLGEIMLGGVHKNAKGNIIKNPILTTFAEDGPEAAIPINDKPRSKALWLQTGQMMGMINTRVGERAISHEIDLRETNALLRRIASKDSNMYMDSMQVSKATSKARDIVDGMESILIGRGVARE